ncbi:MAG TPA: MFS transporter, partial [Stellaceae bacterium]|nr:MFS transporter [Stellaceae bacterium]
FNLALGLVGFAIGVGATLSTAAAGWIGDHFGQPIAFTSLAITGLAGLLLAWSAMPETRQRRRRPANRREGGARPGGRRARDAVGAGTTS